MLRFKEFIKEYLLPKQSDDLKKQVSDQYPHHDNYMTKEARSATDHFFGKGNDLIKEPLKNYEHDKSEIHQAVEKHLNKPITHEEYTKGTTSDKYGRQVKLGKLITDPKLRNEFASDNTRAGTKKNQQHYVSVVRGIEVGGQTNSQPNAEHPKGHSWGEESCKNVDTGMNRKYLTHEIPRSVLVRVHDHNDQEIYRATLQPHHNETGDTAYAMDAEYGVKHPSFTAHAHDVASRLSGEYKHGVYKKHDKVYNNSNKYNILHPNATADHITHILKNENNQTDPDGSIRQSAISLPNFNADHISYVLNKKNKFNTTMRELAIKHPKTNADHISYVLSHENNKTDTYGHMRRLAISHPNTTADHITHILTHENDKSDPDQNIRQEAISHSKLNADHITHILNPQNKFNNGSRRLAIEHHNATIDHITHVLKNENEESDPYSNIRVAALKHSKSTADHITQTLEHENKKTDPYGSVRRVAINHSKVNIGHINHVLNNENDESDPDGSIREGALKARKNKVINITKSDK